MGRHLEPPLLHRADAVLNGITDAELLRGRQLGELVQIAHGSYLAEPAYRELDERSRHRAKIFAAAHRHQGTPVFSHASAAVLHGLDLWQTPLKAVHITRADGKHGRRRPAVHHHATPLGPGEIVIVDGLSVTSPARTIADLARFLPLRSAVAAGDHALRLGLRRQDLHDAVEAAAGRHGAAKARNAVDLMDGRSESVGESLSRLLLRELKIPVPELQHRVRSASGEELGRVDFYFPEAGVVGEFDGRAKYGKFLRPGQLPGDAVYLEKLREDRIRDTGLIVVRWEWADLSRPETLRRRILRALERGRALRR